MAEREQSEVYFKFVAKHNKNRKKQLVHGDSSVLYERIHKAKQKDSFSGHGKSSLSFSKSTDKLTHKKIVNTQQTSEGVTGSIKCHPSFIYSNDSTLNGWGKRVNMKIA